MDLVRYPDPAVQVLDDSFAKYRVFNAAVERLATGFRWAEGPVWFGDGRYLLWSDIPNNRIMRWDEETGAVSVFRKPSNFSNGNTRDRQGRERHPLRRGVSEGTPTVEQSDQSHGTGGHPPSPEATAGPPYIDSLSIWFRICTPCTSDAPPRIAAATCTASVICSGVEPFSSDAVLYASMQYGH